MKRRLFLPDTKIFSLVDYLLINLFDYYIVVNLISKEKEENNDDQKIFENLSELACYLLQNMNSIKNREFFRACKFLNKLLIADVNVWKYFSLLN